MNKSFSYVNLSLEWLLVSTFWLGCDTSGTFSLHFFQPYHMNFLNVRHPFLFPSFCKLNHISLCFIQISTKSAYSLQGKQCFFWSHPRCFWPLGKFQHNIKISVKTARVSRLSVSYDYGAWRAKSERPLAVSLTICKINEMYLWKSWRSHQRLQLRLFIFPLSENVYIVIHGFLYDYMKPK